MKILQGNNLPLLKLMNDNSVDSVVTDPPYGLSFMGKKWDYDVPSKELWEEVLRVLKPGGHALIACGTRTQHRMVVNIEDAGFEIRDVVSWIYGSGFPKSLNVSKAIDKAAGAEREVVGTRTTGIGTGGGSTPIMGDSDNRDITAPATEAAKQWDGWGTALKPACEFFTLARKPLSEKTIAKNVLKWGTGGINIDGCRVGTEDKMSYSKSTKEGVTQFGTGTTEQHTQGRFPANFIHDGSDEVVGLFPDTKGGSPVRKNKKNPYGNDRTWSVSSTPAQETAGYVDSGSASRFFYCAKASKAERNKGCEGLEERQTTGGGGGIGDYKDDVNSMSGKYGSEKAPSNNHHPTVKPLKLMQYLVRLVTPKGGTVLDPFMGSGSTGKACKLENFDFIGMELDEDYYKIAKARINAINKAELL